MGRVLHGRANQRQQSHGQRHSEFFDWLERLPEFRESDAALFQIATEHVATYREWLVKVPTAGQGSIWPGDRELRSVTTVKLKMSTIRSLFRCLKEVGILAEDPAAPVRDNY